jgi:3-dehydroquinate dehydratase / shikimate dehydrogenase
MVEAEVYLSSVGVKGEAVLFGQDRICAVVAVPTAQEMLRELRVALKKSRTVELRLDWLKNAEELDYFLAHLRVNRAKACILATLRRRQAGGKYKGDVTGQLSRLVAAAEAGCAWCDLEVESAERLDAGALRELRRAGAQVMISFHDFRGTPRDLGRVTRRLERCHGDAIKIAAEARTIRDGARLLAVAHSRRNVIAVPMGEAGLPGRVLALRAGSALAYAATGTATAPGQLSIAEMRGVYRADQLDRHTRVYGVIGDPIAHSLSPVMHNAAFRARGVNAVLIPFFTPSLRDFLQARGPLNIVGFAVTLPHKQAIIHHLAECDPLAARIGAVNTVVVRGNGKLYGYNTDYVGVLRALESRVRLAASRVLLIGAGGAARAAAFALAEAGAVVCIWARREAQSKALARAVGGEAIARRQLKGEFFDAIVNATPAGLHPNDEAPLRADELNCRVVMDMVYRPMRTPLMRLAERRGIQTVSGAEMFLAQGIAQWEIWMGERAPEKIMRRVVLRALRQEEKRTE